GDRNRILSSGPSLYTSPQNAGAISAIRKNNRVKTCISNPCCGSGPDHDWGALVRSIRVRSCQMSAWRVVGHEPSQGVQKPSLVTCVAESPYGAELRREIARGLTAAKNLDLWMVGRQGCFVSRFSSSYSFSPGRIPVNTI